MSIPYRRRHTDRRGLTLIELLLAVALSGLIGVAIAMMLRGVALAALYHEAAAAESIDDAIARTRLGTAFRRAAAVLQSTDTGCVLWLGDYQGNGHPELSELLILEHSEAKSCIVAYEAIPDLDPELDTTYDASDDLLARTAPLRGTQIFPGSVMVRGVAELRVMSDASLGPRTVIDLERSDGHTPSQCRMVVCMRASEPFEGVE